MFKGLSHPAHHFPFLSVLRFDSVVWKFTISYKFPKVYNCRKIYIEKDLLMVSASLTTDFRCIFLKKAKQWNVKRNVHSSVSRLFLLFYGRKKALKPFFFNTSFYCLALLTKSLIQWTSKRNKPQLYHTMYDCVLFHFLFKHSFYVVSIAMCMFLIFIYPLSGMSMYLKNLSTFHL